MKVKEMMAQPVLVVNETASLEEVARLLLDHRIGCAPVVNCAGKIIGIITESDFAAKRQGIPFSTFRAPQVLGQWMGRNGVEQLYEAARQMTTREIMQSQVITVTEEQTMDEVVEQMLRYDINRIPVVRDNVPVGIVARHDLLRMMVANNCGVKAE